MALICSQPPAAPEEKIMTKKRTISPLFILSLKSCLCVAKSNEPIHNNIRRRRVQTACHHSAKYHTAMTAGKTCTNDNVYPPSWDKPPMNETFFFEKPADCCNFFFQGFTDCNVINVCGGDLAGGTTDAPTTRPSIAATSSGTTGQVAGSAGSSNPTHAPTKSQQQQAPYTYPSTNPCYSRKWHPDTTSLLSKCTNDLNFPNAWNNGIMDGITMFTDATSCCEKLKKSSGSATCDIKEDSVCTPQPKPTSKPTTQAPTSKPTAVSVKATIAPTKGVSMGATECTDNKWHPDSHYKGCNNEPSGSYPPEWDSPALAQHYLFNSYEDCCGRFFKNRECIKTDSCHTVEDCSTNKWHPTTDFKSCTNNLDFPSSWADPPMSINYMHDSYDKCCSTIFSGRECPKLDVCGTVEEVEVKCTDLLWHPTTDFKSCSNNKEYPSSWSKPPMSDNYMHASYDDCCNAVFSGRECPKLDICESTVEEVKCNELLWHPTTDFKSCSNNKEYPSSWSKPPMSDNYMHSTYDKCCHAVFSGRECPKLDICGTDEPVDEADCLQQLWHPTTDFKTCSNSLDFPSSWAKPPMSANYMHASYDECCAAVFSGRECPKENICGTDEPVEIPPCSEQLWHPTTDWSACSNSKDYPSAWTTENYLVHTYEQCCSNIFHEGPCPKEDVCNRTSVTNSPTSGPVTPQPVTQGATPPPEQNPTQSSTSAPGTSQPVTQGATPPPVTEEPPCSEQLWHPTPDFQYCSNSKDHPTDWTTDNYLVYTYEQCCFDHFGEIPCPKDDVCFPPNTTPQAVTSSPTGKPTICKTAKWHPSASNDETCSNSPQYNSLWDLPALSKTYLHDTHASCCQKYYGLDTCGKEDVCSSGNENNDSTSSPSRRPTTTLPSKYPTGKPTNSSTSSPSKRLTSSPTHKPIENTATVNDMCSLKKFHPVSIFNRKCTNDDYYPPLWNTMTSTYFFASANDCCNKFYTDGRCVIEDTCTDPDRTPANTQNCGKKWHPTTETNRACSNGEHYPPLWDSLGGQYLFATAQECCQAFYSQGNGQCDIVNTC